MLLQSQAGKIELLPRCGRVEKMEKFPACARAADFKWTRFGKMEN